MHRNDTRVPSIRQSPAVDRERLAEFVRLIRETDPTTLGQLMRGDVVYRRACQFPAAGGSGSV